MLNSNKREIPFQRKLIKYFRMFFLPHICSISKKIILDYKCGNNDHECFPEIKD